MLIDKINLNHLRVFECVYQNRSMTKSAGELFLTQSGVSQHIKHLEDTLEVKLFDRIKHRLVPTQEAKELYLKCSESLSQIEAALDGLSSQRNKLRGNVSLGIPLQFGNDMILPLLSAFGQRHPQLQFSIFYGYASDMQDKMLSGELDMAIVDDYPFDPAVQIHPIYREELHLCLSFNGFSSRTHDPI